MSELFNNSEITILIVDDTRISLMCMKEILDKEGYRTFCAGNGEESIESAFSNEPDLILLDINLPDISGIDVCKKLKKNGTTKDIPVIFVTASTEDAVIKEAFDAGGSDYISKPLNNIELLTRIRSVISKKILREKLLEEEKLKSILEIAGAVCHQLNQPLHAISGFSELILLDIDENHPHYKAVKTIHDQAQRMGEITSKLQRITKYETMNYLQGTNIIDIEKSSISRENL